MLLRSLCPANFILYLRLKSAGQHTALAVRLQYFCHLLYYACVLSLILVILMLYLWCNMQHPALYFAILFFRLLPAAASEPGEDPGPEGGTGAPQDPRKVRNCNCSCSCVVCSFELFLLFFLSVQTRIMLVVAILQCLYNDIVDHSSHCLFSFLNIPCFWFF